MEHEFINIVKWTLDLVNLCSMLMILLLDSVRKSLSNHPPPPLKTCHNVFNVLHWSQRLQKSSSNLPERVNLPLFGTYDHLYIIFITQGHHMFHFILIIDLEMLVFLFLSHCLRHLACRKYFRSTRKPYIRYLSQQALCITRESLPSKWSYYKY